MKIFFFLFFFIMTLQLFLGQSKMTVQKCLDLIHFDLRNYNHADLQPLDTLLDEKNGYFDIKSYDQTLCQVTYFKNVNESYLVLSTGYYSDMQCFNYFSFFHSISANLDSAYAVNPNDYFPKFLFEDFFIDDSIPKIISKYLPEINSNYLENGTIQDVLNEIYDFHYILPQRGTQLIVELTLCDYIPTNVINITENDWSILVNHIQPIYLKYNKKKMLFERK